MEALRDPITQEVLPIVFEQGKPKAVILDIRRFKALLILLENSGALAKKEAKILGRSPTFKKIVKRALQEISEGKVEDWRKTLAEL